MDIKVSLLGLVVGFMVGLTGMGVVMTPALILFGWAGVLNLIRAHNVQ